MSAILTEKFNVNKVENFLADINSNNSAYYFWCGGVVPWPIESVPPAAENTFEEFEQSTYHDIVFGKLISNNNVSYLINRYNWEANTVYAQYDPNDANLFNENFYVLNSNYSVYKCIDNNGQSPSTVQPLITPTSGVFQTSDGYTWKFMYSIPTNANTLFTSNQFIPVVPNTFVANNAVPGTIDVMRVTVGGYGYQGYDINYLSNVIDQNSVQIANTGVGIDNFYVGSSIYLNGGSGESQIRQITGYDGGTKIVSVTPAFNTFVNLFLANNMGSFIIGQSVNQQVIYLSYLFGQGFFNAGDILIQSDSGAIGIISAANSSTFILNQTSNAIFSVTNGAYPVIDTTQGGVLQTGTVSVNTGSNIISAANGANLYVYSTNTFIQVGNTQFKNVRRISSIINSTSATVSVPFNNTLSSNVHYQIDYAAEPVSETLVNSNGIITQVNLNSIIVNYGNLSSNSLSFILGETVKEFNANNQDQASNGIISFVNSSAIVISSINGTIATGQFLVGQSSTLKAQITSINSYPNITIANSEGNWILGSSINAFFSNGVPSGNAVVISSAYSPSSLTQYIISPTVNIEGDGNGALAYCVVNTNINSNYAIESIVMVNNGSEYTIANAYISANSVWGSGAVIAPVLSPAEGHGSNTYVELGAQYAGISVLFNNAATENYYFPNYGSYRKVGIIKNPLFYDLYVSTSNVTHYSANITVSSSNNFANGEIIFQSSSNSAALVIYANSTYLELKNISGNLTSNTSNSAANSSIIGLNSNATSVILNLTPKQFILNNNQQIMTTIGNNVVGNLSQVVSNNQIRLTNVSGKFTANQMIFDPTTNAYANATSFSSSNGYVNSTATFGLRFNQTSRLTFGSNTNNLFFANGEYVTQAATNASGLVLNNCNELDLTYNLISGVFTTGITITDMTTNANAIITFANNSYLKLTAVNGNFNVGDNIKVISANATITAIYPVIVLSDLLNEYPFQVSSSNLVTGNTSGAQGYISIANTVSYPDLVRNTGEVLYLNTVAPFTLTPNTTQTFSLTLKL
jgi:hypothetical protein